ncbi:histone-lysine N-methyltransferase SETMAR [Trichonephila clavipes]|nr:histone-lysine N-methyltransferase SETMAR [Trichonephila clavipes]
MDFLHQDNTLMLIAFSVNQFSAAKQIILLEHPPYSPVLTPRDFYLFSKVKTALKETQLQSLEEVKAKMVYFLMTVTPNELQHCFESSGIFDVKYAPHTGSPVVENVDKIIEIIEVDRHVRSPSITQGQKIDHKKVLSYLRKVGFKKKLHVWMSHQLTPKNMMDRISMCEALAKRNETDPFLKRMVIGDEKCVTLQYCAKTIVVKVR